MPHSKQKPLATVAWCRRCNAGPYAWRAGLRKHVNDKHPELGERDRSELVARSIQPPKP